MNAIDKITEYKKNVKNQFIQSLKRNLSTDERTAINRIDNISYLESITRELKESDVIETEKLITQINKRFL